MRNYLEDNWENYINDLKGLIEIPSFLKKKDEYPNIYHKEALKYMENLAKANGMKVFTNPEGYYGYIEIGQGEKMIGILAHLDVVSPEDLSQWTTNPFELVKDGNRIIGRGTNDDKGPLMLSFYLMKELIENKIPLNKRIRLIYATDEESPYAIDDKSSFRGMKEYIKKGEEIPTAGWTPDSFFPIVSGEKGFLQYELSPIENINFELNVFKKEEQENFEITYYGNKGYQVKCEMDKFGYEYEINDDDSLSAPWIPNHERDIDKKEIETNLRLIQIVSIVENSNFLKFMIKYIENETTGDILLGKHYEDETGSIINWIVKAWYKQSEETTEKFSVLMNLRAPLFAINLSEIEKIIIEKCKMEGIKYTRCKKYESFSPNMHNHFFQFLLKIYKEFTGSNEVQPIVIEGGTYARTLPNIIAFGPYFKDSPNTEHQPNEYALKSDLIKAYSIYNVIIKNI